MIYPGRQVGKVAFVTVLTSPVPENDNIGWRELLVSTFTDSPLLTSNVRFGNNLLISNSVLLFNKNLWDEPIKVLQVLIIWAAWVLIFITFKTFPSSSKSITNTADPTFGFTAPLYPPPNTATHLSLPSTLILIILGVDQVSPNFL